MNTPKRRPNHDIVLRALDVGVEVTLPNGYTYEMFEDQLHFQMKVWLNGRSPTRDNEPDEIRLCVADMTMNYFMKQCDLMSEEDIIGLAAATALRKINRKDR